MKALEDVVAERLRQVKDEGFSPDHDDAYVWGELAAAARSYLDPSSNPAIILADWPWPPHWWKPTTRRRNLVKAAALILAEIERLDRLESRSEERSRPLA